MLSEVEYGTLRLVHKTGRSSHNISEWWVEPSFSKTVTVEQPQAQPQAQA